MDRKRDAVVEAAVAGTFLGAFATLALLAFLTEPARPTVPAYLASAPATGPAVHVTFAAVRR